MGPYPLITIKFNIFFFATFFFKKSRGTLPYFSEIIIFLERPVPDELQQADVPGYEFPELVPFPFSVLLW